MRLLALALTVSAAAFAQSAPESNTAAAADAKTKKPPTPREYAQQLLEAVHDTAGAADPQLSPFIAWRSADAYIAVDKKKAATMLEDAFATAVAIPPDAPFNPRPELQVYIVQSMAGIDLAKSAELLPRIHVTDDERSYDPRSFAASRIVSSYIKNKQIDDAIDFANSLGAGGPYPYAVASRIIEALEPTTAVKSFFSPPPSRRTRFIPMAIS